MMSADETRAMWIEEYETVNTRRRASGTVGVANPDMVAGKSGLEVMQDLLAGKLPLPPMADTLDYLLVHVEHGKAVFQGTPQAMHYNPMGGVHGGWFATLLDSALGCAVQTALPAGLGYTTAELSVNIVRGANAKTGPLRAIGEVIHCGRQLATAQARLVGPDGKLYAHGTTTCLVFEPQPRKI
jgi:uncharacterized protein (TIGR00369 family)